MIIKVIPETEAEKQRMQTVEHLGVKDFLMFGNKHDSEDSLVDFHDWSGSYRYLEGSLYHFLTTITEEKKFKMRNKQEVPFQRMNGPMNSPNSPFIKTGEVDEQKINVFDASGLIKNKASDEEIAAAIEQLSRTPNDPNLTITTEHFFPIKNEGDGPQVIQFPSLIQDVQENETQGTQENENQD